MFVQILDFRAFIRWPVKRCVRQFSIRDGNAKAGAELPQFLFVEQLLLVGDISPLTALPKPIAFDGFGENDRRCAMVFDRRFVRRIDLFRVVSTAPHLAELLIGEVTEHLQQARIITAHMLADVGAIRDGIFLIFTIDDFAHAPDQDAVVILGQQWVPIVAPDHLDDIPASTAKHRLEFLDDLAVTTHRAVQALQIAVDDKN